MNKWIKTCLVCILSLGLFSMTFSAMTLDVERKEVYEEFVYFDDLQETPDGGYAFIGAGYGKADDGHTTSGVFAGKLNANYEIEWINYYSTSIPLGLNVDAAGSIIVAEGTNLNGSSNNQTKITKYSTDGVVQWSTSLAGTLKDNYLEVIPLDDGSYIAAGTVYKDSGARGLVTKVNKDGQIEWRKEYGNDKNGFSSVSLMSNGLIALGGSKHKVDVIVGNTTYGDLSGPMVMTIDQQGMVVSEELIDVAFSGNIRNMWFISGATLFVEGTIAVYNDTTMSYSSQYYAGTYKLGDNTIVSLNDKLSPNYSIRRAFVGENGNIVLLGSKRLSNQYDDLAAVILEMKVDGTILFEDVLKHEYATQYSAIIYTKDGGYVASGAEYPSRGLDPALNHALLVKVSPRFNMTFDLNGGTTLAETTQPVFLDALAIKPSNPEKQGYVFKGWTLTKDGNDLWDFSTSKMPYSDVTLYAKWEKITENTEFTLNFNVNGMEGVSAPGPQLIKAGSSAVLPLLNTPGYVVKSWNTKADGTGVNWDFNTDKMPTNDVTLFAIWEKVDPSAIITLTLDFNGGIDGEVKEYIQQVGTKIMTPVTPTRDGYTFIGWNTQKDGHGTYWDFDQMVMPSADFTLYAQWEKNVEPTSKDSKGNQLPKTGLSNQNVFLSLSVVTLGCLIVLIDRKRQSSQ